MKPKTPVRTREVFLAYTTNETLGWKPELLRIYAKKSYQDAYNWLADKAEMHGNALQPMGLKYPVVGTSKVVAKVINPDNRQEWWLERHEVL